MDKESGKADKAGANEPEESNWASDQQKRDYYYDDSHGYEIYDPAQEDDEDNEVDEN